MRMNISLKEIGKTFMIPITFPRNRKEGEEAEDKHDLDIIGNSLIRRNMTKW